MRSKTFAAASLALLLTAPAAAGTLDTTFRKHACYARNYDAAHLVRHPRQTVARLALNYVPQNADGKPNTPARFELGFGFALKGSSAAYDGNAICTSKSGGFDCSLEGDGGLFRLTPQGVGLRLAVVNRGGTDAGENQINVEGEDFGGFGKPGGDDLVFDLIPAQGGACSMGEQY